MTTKELILPLTYEEITHIFKKNELLIKMMEFVQPVLSAEEQINYILTQIKSSGKVLFLLGNPGTGKSTFIQSLGWRSHITFREIVNLDANNYIQDGSLNLLFNEMSNVGKRATGKKDAGPTLVVIDYLEYLDDFDESEIRGFFRKINGLLRNSPILIIWPLTNENDAKNMLNYSSQVSNTLFSKGKEIIPFQGPEKSNFVDIVKSTITVLNPGYELSEFNLTHDDLTEAIDVLNKESIKDQTLRKFIEIVKDKWELNSNIRDEMLKKIPKPNEVWFVFAYKEAEKTVSNFIKRSHRVEDSWTPIHDKLFEYIHDSQRASIWDAKRLQLALYGAIKTRILYIPTNTLISVIAAFSDSQDLLNILSKNNIPAHWSNQSQAVKSLSKSPIYKQLINEVFPAGYRKGGTAVDALNTAEPVFEEVVNWITSSGSDKEINKALSKALNYLQIKNCVTEKKHPWLNNIIPDLLVEESNKNICIEFHYTKKDEHHVIADYVLKKLNTYLLEIENFVKNH